MALIYGDNVCNFNISSYITGVKPQKNLTSCISKHARQQYVFTIFSKAIVINTTRNKGFVKIYTVDCVPLGLKLNILINSLLELSIMQLFFCFGSYRIQNFSQQKILTNRPALCEQFRLDRISM